MTTKQYRPIVLGIADANREREVQQEIETFLTALSSYPDRFAHDPYLSFEQYLYSIAVARQALPDCHSN